MAEPSGQTFADFEIIAKPDEGGLGVVYMGRQPLLAQPNMVFACRGIWRPRIH